MVASASPFMRASRASRRHCRALTSATPARAASAHASSSPGWASGAVPATTRWSAPLRSGPRKGSTRLRTDAPRSASSSTSGRPPPGVNTRGASGGRMSADIRRETEELVRYYGELVRRLGQSGVRDVADLLALYERLGRALEAVSRQEIGWVTEQVQRLIEALVRMDSNLDALRRLKGVLSAPLEGVSQEPAARPR